MWDETAEHVLLICGIKSPVPVVGATMENPNIVLHVLLRIVNTQPKQILISVLNVKNILVFD
jgi:hypothetical protein